jgi:DNA-binding transcriptional LysR family regulator
MARRSPLRVPLRTYCRNRDKGLLLQQTNALIARMDLDALRIFVAVARRGSFAAVARERDTDPSSVSRAVAGLEDRLGLRLLQRTTRHVALTEAGSLYLARVEPLIDELARASEEALAAAAGPSGTLRLTTSVAFGQMKLVPLLPALRAAYPALRLELLLTDSNLDLVAERVDLAIRLAPRVVGDFIAARLLTTRYHVCATPEYLAAGSTMAEPAQLVGRSCLLSALPDYRSCWRFRDDSGQVAEIGVAGDVVTTNALALRACALAGMGPALLPDWLIGEDLRTGQLVDPFPNHRVTATDFDTGVWFVYPSREWLPTKVRSAMSFIQKAMK